MEASQIQDAAEKKYGAIAKSVKAGGSCCGPSCCSPADPITGNLNGASQTDELPNAIDASLGCGIPTALIDLHEGEVVLDLARAEASAHCCRRAAWARRAKCTAWI